jgi:2-polyprenyl-3-methyl-5-hydroxy-6-metoxy-1,4-benzoquinol methylase
MPDWGKSEPSLQFEKDYFSYLNYSTKGKLIAHHVLESLRWASKVLNQDLLKGAGKSALDVGCAFGYGVGALRSLGYEAWGTDISSYGLTQARKNVNEGVFLVCDVQHKLPFAKRFDVVTCFEVLEHLENPAMALRNLCEASDNVVLCTTPNKTVEQFFKKLVRNFDKTHINVKTPHEWEALIRETIDCKRVKIECFVDSSFQFANTSFYKSLKLPFGMETRIIIKK